MYTILLFLGFVFMNVMLVQSIQESMIREFSYFDETCEVAEEKKFGECSYIVGITMVLRICLALSSFHFILAVLTVKVANSSSWRGSVHNGMWGLKFCALCLIFLATFLIPVRDNNSDARTIFVVTLVAVLAALAFIIIKMVLIIAVIREWCYKWLKTLSKAAKKCVTWAMFLTSLGILIAVGFGFKFVYENYNRHEWCSYNLPVIIANGVLCLFLVIVSITNDGSSDDKVVEQYCGPSLSTTVSNNAIICYVGIFMAFAAVIKET
ncbi:serine incorporator 5-like [Uloborus diversus]|uniref:serine incorporator 5-like n=1 Tax=Uloborus diversus TaxID=327109 RepID=UPI002409E43A|nr:serine incorporator 5-like [Uloborus diversus]